MPGLLTSQAIKRQEQQAVMILRSISRHLALTDSFWWNHMLAAAQRLSDLQKIHAAAWRHRFGREFVQMLHDTSAWIAERAEIMSPWSHLDSSTHISNQNRDILRFLLFDWRMRAYVTHFCLWAESRNTNMRRKSHFGLTRWSWNDSRQWVLSLNWCNSLTAVFLKDSLSKSSY